MISRFRRIRELWFLDFFHFDCFTCRLDVNKEGFKQYEKKKQVAP